MPQLWRPWRRPRYALGSPILGWPFTRARKQTPEALAAVQKADIEKWWPIIKISPILTKTRHSW
jgi:hypothetical protein